MSHQTPPKAITGRNRPRPRSGSLPESSTARPPKSTGLGRIDAGFEPLATVLSDAPASYRRRWERLASQATSSYRAAVELKCCECVAWQRVEAKRCEIRSCPLWVLSGRIFGREQGEER
jgi:hypothetical protein